MATGTGKTLVAGGIIKLFLRTRNANRVLFLVDRIELEDQAEKHLKIYLKNDYQCVIYKENRDDWRRAEIVVSTVQSFLFKNKYKRIFSPSDFDLVISDEAHRSLTGNTRAVFEYFMGYKLGLTATPKDYLKNIDPEKVRLDDPRELERRILLDTYKTFGCENGIPTFRYSLLDGVKEGFLVNPIVVDARTDITTQLLSDEGYSVIIPYEQVEDFENVEETFIHSDFERKFFSENTNRVFCKSFIENALPDPISKEIGKTIIFCVSQRHTSKITQILNEYADQMFPGKYNSDFAIQVTSQIQDAKQFRINFANNNLSGSCNFDERYKTGKTRVCVTVGMMSTGYDCPDILNLCLMRPIFSPTDFIQIKGRGTRKHNFTEQILDDELKKEIGANQKQNFKLFDFFANCEYFEEKFNYDEVLELPKEISEPPRPPTTQIQKEYKSEKPDIISTIEETHIGLEGMKIDRMYFDKFEEKVKDDSVVKEYVQKLNWENAIDHIIKNIFDKPEEYFNLEKLRKSIHIDRRITLREILEKIFGLIPYIKTKNELLNDEFDKFDSIYLPQEKDFISAKNVFKSYISDSDFRKIIDSGNYALLNVHPNGEAFKKLSPSLRKTIPEYIKDFIPMNKFMT